MKTCDEMMNSLFERRKQYVAAQRKKKKMLASGAASLCAVSLLGGGVWYLGQPRHNAPVTVTPNGDAQTTITVDNKVTTTTLTTGNGTQTPTTTTAVDKDKLLVMGDKPDTYGADELDSGFKKGEPISPLLKEAMELYKDTDAVYAVLVAINSPYGFYPSISLDDDADPSLDPGYYNAYHQFMETDEMVQLEAEKQAAYEAYIEAENALLKAVNEGSATTEQRLEYSSKHEAYRTLRSKKERWLRSFYEEYYETIMNQQLQGLEEMSDVEPIKLPIVPNPVPYIWAIQSFSWGGHAYSAVLSAAEITCLAEQGGYMFWLNSPETDKDMDYGYLMTAFC